MDLPDKDFERFITNAKKDGVKLETDDEYRQLYRDLYALAGITFDIWKFQKSLDRRFKKNKRTLRTVLRTGLRS
ncbi:MAG: hypothetical protein WCG30_00430 [Candidatus Saccharibacteria bacterium]